MQYYRSCYHHYANASAVFLLILGGMHVSRGQAASTSNECMNQRCGNVNVKYPFTIGGLDSPCPSFKQNANDTIFTLNCTQDVLYLGNMPVMSILEDSLIINQSDFKSSYNTDQHGACNVSEPIDDRRYRIRFPYGGPYIAAADNQFGSFGCSAGFLFTSHSDDATAYDTGGCEPFCGFNGFDSPQVNKSKCGDKLNCCISNFPAPSRVTYYYITYIEQDPSACSSYAVPFHPNFSNFQNDTYGVRVLWALPDHQVLNQAKSMKKTVFNVAELPGNVSTACSGSNSSQVIIVSEVPGYRCSCLPGYLGDGYTNGTGCVETDECRLHTDLCVVRQAECRNTNGSYSCHCKSRWRVGDGMRNGIGCPISPALIKAIAITGGVIGVMLLLLCIVSANIVIDRRRRRRYFRQNGGLELQAYIAAHGTGRESTRFFTTEELRVATQNFSEQLRLGTGGFGTVYRGTLKGGRVVAIKKANQPGDTDRKQFLNELAILTQINHRHIVRLHGCCLETANPLLVYEFVSNGDLAENLASASMVMGWAKRLQVATQVADALAYLHAAAVPPILHRDVKTANILLDDNLDAKVADFGISRLIPEGDQNCVSTVVQGTLGYLDPEYFQTLQLTDKSDVYSMGVVLVELITGLKPVDNHEREVKFANLALLFIDRIKEERVHELMDARLDGEDMDVEAKWRLHSSIQHVAYLAWRCLALRGEERPSMRELAMELHHASSAFAQLRSDAEDELRPLIVPAGFAEFDKNSCLY